MTQKMHRSCIERRKLKVECDYSSNFLEVAEKLERESWESGK
jgi:hypothetical protein